MNSIISGKWHVLLFITGVSWTLTDADNASGQAKKVVQPQPAQPKAAGGVVQPQPGLIPKLQPQPDVAMPKLPLAQGGPMVAQKPKGGAVNAGVQAGGAMIQQGGGGIGQTVEGLVHQGVKGKALAAAIKQMHMARGKGKGKGQGKGGAQAGAAAQGGQGMAGGKGGKAGGPAQDGMAGGRGGKAGGGQVQGGAVAGKGQAGAQVGAMARGPMAAAGGQGGAAAGKAAKGPGGQGGGIAVKGNNGPMGGAAALGGQGKREPAIQGGQFAGGRRGPAMVGARVRPAGAIGGPVGGKKGR